MINKFFIRLLFFLTFFYFSFISISLSEIVNKFQIEGNQRVSNETIKMFSGIIIGDDVSQSTLNDILKRIYDSNFFDNVNVSINNNILSIQVTESALIENVDIKGPKAKKIIKLLKKNLKLKARTSFNDILVKEDKNKIINDLKLLGYFFSKVDVVIETLNDNKVNLIYEIDMGEKAKIKKISFIGDKIFKDRKLRSIIVSEEYKFWKFISGKKFLNQSLIELDERLLKNFYLNKGYYNIEINTSFAKLVDEKESSFELIYNINANKKHVFNNLTLELPLDSSTLFIE